MNENVSSDLETITDNISNSEISVGEDFTSNHANETPENIPSRETGTSELNAEEIVSGFSKENIEVACENDDKEDPSQFESRTASVSFNSDSTAENSCVTAEGKFEEENSTPDLGNNNTDAVAGESLEGQLSEIPATKENPFLQSVKYLEKHQILRLFQVRFAGAPFEAYCLQARYL